MPGFDRSKIRLSMKKFCEFVVRAFGAGLIIVVPIYLPFLLLLRAMLSSPRSLL